MTKPQYNNDNDEFETADYAKQTEWFNPTEKDIVLRICVGATHTGGCAFKKFRFPAKKSAFIPSELDVAVQKLDPNTIKADGSGVIIGGKSPHLRRVGYNDELHYSLDADGAEKKEAMERAKKLMEEKQILDQLFAQIPKDAVKVEPSVEAKARIAATKELQDKMVEEKVAKASK